MPNIINAILELPDQCIQAWSEASQINLPEDWDVKNIIVCGMGGSALGAHVFQNNTALKIPFTIVNDYHLPAWANKDSLVILISYSGNTEEVLSCASEAKDMDCRILGITTGGKLGTWLEVNEYAKYVFDPKFNSTGQPRMGIGYCLFALIGLLNSSKYSFEVVTSEDVMVTLKHFKETATSAREQAEDFAGILKGKVPVIFGAENINANAHIFANQLNETAKTFATWFSLPEANHHLLEGLKHPELKMVGVILGNSYSEKITKRLNITTQILDRNKWEVLWYRPQVEGGMALVLDILLFTSLVSAYLSKIYEEDPIAIPNIDYFKEKLV